MFSCFVPATNMKIQTSAAAIDEIVATTTASLVQGPTDMLLNMMPMAVMAIFFTCAILFSYMLFYWYLCGDEKSKLNTKVEINAITDMQIESLFYG